MIRAEILTRWTPERTIECAHHLQPGDSAMDITGQPVENIEPDPNVFSVLVECAESTLAAIEADGDCLVLWSEEIVNEELA